MCSNFVSHPLGALEGWEETQLVPKRHSGQLPHFWAHLQLVVSWQAWQELCSETRLEEPIFNPSGSPLPVPLSPVKKRLSFLTEQLFQGWGCGKDLQWLNR